MFHEKCVTVTYYLDGKKLQGYSTNEDDIETIEWATKYLQGWKITSERTFDSPDFLPWMRKNWPEWDYNRSNTTSELRTILKKFDKAMREKSDAEKALNAAEQALRVAKFKLVMVVEKHSKAQCP